ncbi:MAG TPA: 5-oxoprolinase subunit PxpB [Mycobacteriales bacterium]|nr:5-oxoprolinase subunit PxpB [Mycobacteriales bacterium]
MIVRSVGWAAALVELDSAGEVRAAYRRLLELRAAGELPGVVEVVPAARTVLVEGGPLPDLAALLGDLTAAPAAEGPAVELPVAYDGPDLADVAELTGLPAGEVVRRHAGTDFVVAFCGFAPGFAYLTGLPAELHVPRRATPRTAVEAGSVGIAGEFSGVYPRRSPGGWQLLGHTDVVLWDTERDPPALLAPGTRVRFVLS